MPPRIVVVGSLMMDLVVRAPRLPLVGESLLSHSFQTSPGGKGANQAIAAARMGASVAMVGRIGRDRFGEILRMKLEEAGVDASNVSVDPEIGTGVAVPIVLDSGENAIFAVPQANMTLGVAEIEAARRLIEAADTLMLNFEVGMDAVDAAARIASSAGVPILLNPAPIAPYSPLLPALARVLVANEVEAAALVPEFAGDHALELKNLLRMSPRVLITLGADGLIGGDVEGTFSLPAFPVTAVDSVGAGDAFCGALAVRLAEGCGLQEAARFASAAGALAVTKPGAQASLPLRSEVEALIGLN
ncbi:MAG: ribokinase [bacterium]